MKYILIGTLLGSFLHSEHDSREACEGRAALLREVKAAVRCVEANPGAGISSTLTCCNLAGSFCGPCR